MQTWNQENSRVKINWEVAFEKFSESRMCRNIKGKREIRLSQRSKNPGMKIFWPVWYFGHIFLLRYRIDLILVAMERGHKDLKLCSLPKLQNLPYWRPKLTWNLTYCWKTGIDILYFPFWEACVLGFWML